MSDKKRKEVIADEGEAAKQIKDGMTVIFGGFATANRPMAIVRQVIKNGIKDLTVLGGSVASLHIDLLIGAGCVKKVIAPYVGAEYLAPIAPFFRDKAQKGEIDVWACEEGSYYAALRAAALMLPFFPWKPGLGTSFPEINPDIKIFHDPIKGETLLAIPAINVDVCVLHVAYADAYGNCQHIGGGFGDRTHYRAADKVIVEAEKIVPNEEIRKDPAKTFIFNADMVIRAPYGSHPFSSVGFHIEDTFHIEEYLKAAESYTKDGDRGPFEAYLQKYIYEPETHLDYLERIGIKRLLSLYEF